MTYDLSDFPTHIPTTFVYLSESGYDRQGKLGEYKMTLTPARVDRLGFRAAQIKAQRFRRWARRFDRECTRRLEAAVRAMRQSDCARGMEW